MNVYGDRGNVLTLVQRCRWRGIDVDVVERGLHERGSLSNFDILFAGGGQDRDQSEVSRDLDRDAGKALVDAVENDVVVLTICGTYQLLGRYFKTVNGDTLPGFGIFDAWTVAGKRRCIGDIVIRAEHAGRQFDLVGFENHGGLTFLGAAGRPLGTVKIGCGNNGVDGFEGATYRQAFGTYLHGPLLPKNPEFADHLIRLAVRRRCGDDFELPALDDSVELQARSAVLDRIRRRGRVKSGVR
jgi:CobQ-like glutamine amidotransferase family enzyme